MTPSPPTSLSNSSRSSQLSNRELDVAEESGIETGIETIGENGDVNSSPTQRFSHGVFWVGLLLLIATAASLLLMPVPFENERLREICDVAHLPLFAVLTWSTLIWRAWRDAWKPQSATWKVAIFWLVVGSLLEVSQQFFNRSSSWEDAIANALGIVIGTSLFHAMSKSTGHYRIPLLVFAALTFIAGWGWSWYQLLQTYR